MAISANGSPQPVALTGPARSIQHAAGRVPAPLANLIGREREIDELLSLIGSRESRLITVTGPGGIGKSRLALELLRGLVNDGGWEGRFVELRDVADHALVLPAIVSALDTPGRWDSRLTNLRQAVAIIDVHRFLLVLDNLEHIRAVSSDIAHLLQACPNLTVLATSREVLGCAGERRVELAPLPVPDAQWPTLKGMVADFPSVRLFIDRALDVCPDLPVNDASVASIAEICRRIDGIPLAIELAAAWTVALSPAAILQELDHLLLDAVERAGDRSRSMGATIAWSYALLNPDERRLFRLLSIFADRIDRYAVEHVAGRAGRTSDPAAISAGIRALIEKSLVVRTVDDAGEFWLGMYEVIREFGRGQLEADGEAGDASDAQADWAIALAERGDHHPVRHHSITANIRLALDWLDEIEDGERFVRLCIAAADLWYLAGHQHEGRERLRRALAFRAAGETKARTQLAEARGRFARAIGDFGEAAAAFESAHDSYRELDDVSGEARCLQSLGSLRIAEHRHDDAVKLCEAALAAHRASGYRTGIAQCLHSIAWVAIERDQLDEAERRLHESLDLVAESDDLHTFGRIHLSLGALCIRRKRYAEASDHFLTSADLWRESGYQSGLAEVMADLGAIAVVTGDLARAVSYLLSSATLYRTLGVLHRSPELVEAGAGLALAHGNLDDARRWLATAAAYRAANDLQPWSPWACHLRQWLRAAYPGDVPDQTRCPSMTDALDEVWQYLGSLPPADAMRSQKPRLSRREQQVLGLIAAGHSDQAIADQLFISRRTASRHVSSILRKLGLESRTAAAVQAIRDGLISI